MTTRTIRPGAVMRDTAGNRIQAHGGGIFRDGDTFYLYGENKERTVEGADIWHWGVRAYSSTDLVNWEDRGLIIPPEPDDETSPLHPTSMMDRPHILFNEATGKYVCWLKIMGRNNVQTYTIMTADAFLGPYRQVATGYRPFGYSCGDFDLDVDPETGRAYIFFEKIHTHVITAPLSDDFTHAVEPHRLELYRELPPDTREAPVHFTRNGKHYLFTSGTTFYHPNPSEVAIADEIGGPYETLGDLHPADVKRTSYGTQISDVVRVPGTDFWFALGDRWLPQVTDARPYLRRYRFGLGMISKIIGLERTQAMFSREKTPPAKRKKLKNWNTATADYVWLPIRWEGERPVIDWHDEWEMPDVAGD
ncbi:MAG: hypothetical protein DI534_05840 [Leifsonia xyli]|nr:MAG: hypothetical protein DI534_05840 [Leifsonia xyli]